MSVTFDESQSLLDWVKALPGYEPDSWLWRATERLEQEHQEFRLQNDREWRAKLDHVKQENKRLREAIVYAHSEGFEWPSDPMPPNDGPLP